MTQQQHITERMCSAHATYEPECELCNTQLEDDILSEAIKEARKAGVHECAYCGFVYYLTTDICPKCNTEVSW